jgi:hypothetical protein
MSLAYTIAILGVCVLFAVNLFLRGRYSLLVSIVLFLLWAVLIRVSWSFLDHELTAILAVGSVAFTFSVLPIAARGAVRLMRHHSQYGPLIFPTLRMYFLFLRLAKADLGSDHISREAELRRLIEISSRKSAVRDALMANGCEVADLRGIYDSLIRSGCALWATANYVPAATLLHPTALDQYLRMSRQGRAEDEIVASLVDFFEAGICRE